MKYIGHTAGRFMRVNLYDHLLYEHVEIQVLFELRKYIVQIFKVYSNENTNKMIDNILLNPNEDSL